MNHDFVDLGSDVDGVDSGMDSSLEMELVRYLSSITGKGSLNLGRPRSSEEELLVRRRKSIVIGLWICKLFDWGRGTEESNLKI